MFPNRESIFISRDFLEFLITFFLADKFASKQEKEDYGDRLRDEIDDLRAEVDRLKTEKEE